MNADDLYTVNVQLGNEAEVAAKIAEAIEKGAVKAFSSVAKDLTKALGDAFRQGFSDANLKRVASAFVQAGQQARNFADSSKFAADAAAALGTRASASAKIAGQAFVDASARADVLSQRLAEIAAERQQAGASLSAQRRKQLDEESKDLGRALTAERQIVRQAQEAINDERRQATAAAREEADNASRERVEILRAESRSAVVETQISGARQLIAERSSAASRLQIQKTTSRLIVESFRFATTQIRALERGIAKTLGFLTSSITSSVSAVGRGVSRIGEAFRRERNVVEQANNDIARSTRSTMERNERSVTESFSRQESVIRSFASNASSAIGSIGSSLGGGGLGRLALGAAGGVFLGDALRRGFNRLATIEEARRGLTILLKDAEAAENTLDNVLNVVRGTPFSLDLFADAAAQLAAFGVEAERIPLQLQAIADASALKGGRADEFVGRLVNIFGQVNTQGKITGETLARLGEAGVDALAILANSYGKTTEETRKMISKGLIPATEGIDLLTKGLLEGTDGAAGATVAFAGLAKGLGDTLRGSIANFGAARARLGAAIIKPFSDGIIALFKFLTAAVDQITRGFAAVADNIAGSRVYKAIIEGLKFITENAKGAVDALEPLWIVLGGALKGLAAAFLVLQSPKIARAIPGLLSVAGFAIRRFLTPVNLLVAAIAGISGLVQLMVSRNVTLGESFSRLGRAVVDAVKPLVELAQLGLAALATVIERFVVPGVEKFVDTLARNLIPVVDAVAGFILRVIVPAVVEFARVIRERVVPFVGRVLRAALEIGREALRRFAVIARAVGEAVGPILARGVELARKGFENLVGFIKREVLPIFASVQRAALITGSVIGLSFVTGLGPAIAIVGALTTAFVVLQRTTDLDVVSALRPAIDGFAKLGEAIRTALGGDFSQLGDGFRAVGRGLSDVFNTIRTNVIGKLNEIRAAVAERLSELFSGPSLEAAFRSLLRFVERVGEILGSIVSDRRLVAAVAIISAGAAALGLAFVKGFAQGIIDNLPELAGLIDRALKAAARQIIKSLTSSLTTFVRSILLVALVGSLARAWFTAGTASSTAYSEGFLTRLKTSFSNIPTFFRGVFGGVTALSAKATNDLKQQWQFTNREILRLGGTIRNQKGQFLGFSEANLARQRVQLARLRNELGAAGVAAIRFRSNMTVAFASAQLAGVGLVNLIKRDFKTAFVQLEVAAKNMGGIIRDAFARAREAGVTAGTAIGAAITSGIGAAISGNLAGQSDNLTGQLAGIGGIVASSLAALAVPGIGPALAGVTAGVGLLSFALARNARAAQEAKQKMEAYYSILKNNDTAADQDAALIEQIADALRELGPGAANVLTGLGLGFADIVQALRDGKDVKDVLKDATFALPTFTDDVKAAVESLGGFQTAVARIEASNLGLVAPSDEMQLISKAFEEAGFNVQDFVDVFLKLEGESISIRQAISNFAAFEPLTQGETRAQQFANAVNAAKTSLENLSATKVKAEWDQRIADAEQNVDKLRDQADKARQALVNLFTNFYSGGDLQRAIDQAVTSIPNLAESLGRAAEQVLPTQAAALRSQAISSFVGTVGDIISAGITEKSVDSIEGIREKIRPALEELNIAEFLGTISKEDADIIRADIEALIISPEVAIQLAKISEADKAIIEAEANQLDIQLQADLAIEAAQAADAVAIASAFAQVALSATAPNFQTAALPLGAAAGRGFDIGWSQEFARFLLSVQDDINNFVRVISRGLVISSPSKVMARLGRFAVEGFALGMRSALASISAVANSIVSLTTGAVSNAAAVRGANEFGRQIGEAISQGIADGVQLGSAISQAITDASTAALTPAQRIAAEVAQAASAIFAQGGQRGIPGASVTQVDVGNARGAVTTAIGGITSVVEAIRQAERDAVRAWFEAEGDVSRLTQAQRDLIANLGQAPSLDITTGQGVTNRQAIVSAGQAIRTYAETLLASGVSAADVAQQTRTLRDQLVAQAQALGFNQQQIAELLTQLGLSDSSLNDFVSQIQAVQAAAQSASVSAADLAAQQAAQDEAARLAAEAAARQQALQDPRFQSQVIQNLTVTIPYGDPRAVALAAANRLAFSGGRR